MDKEFLADGLRQVFFTADNANPADWDRLESAEKVEFGSFPIIRELNE